MKHHRWVPLGECILVEEEPFESYDKHIGLKHIVVPDQYEHGPKDRNPWGRVVAIGPKVTGVAVGNRITWGKFSGQRYEKGGKVMVLVLEQDVLAKEASR